MTDVDMSALHRAGAARRELRETGQAFDDLRAALLDKLLTSPAEATATREKCYFAVNALDAVRTALQSIIEGGLIEEALQEMLSERKAAEGPFVLPISGAV